MKVKETKRFNKYRSHQWKRSLQMYAKCADSEEPAHSNQIMQMCRPILGYLNINEDFSLAMVHMMLYTEYSINR